MLISNTNQQSDIFTNLNSEQIEAVKSLNGPLLIIAGAGSGKTKVITHRIANLIANGNSPSGILALTFTNKAAKELKERISKLIGFEKAKFLWTGTFHSVFARILRTEAVSLGYTNTFSIYDTDDSNSQIRQIIKALNYTEKSINAASIRNKISSLKSKLVTSSEFSTKAQTYDEKFISEIYSKYEYNLKVNNAMDFDDILVNMIVLLRSSKDLLKKYQTQFKYILIDEYQDTNQAQYIAIKLLASSHQNLCVVGDDAQSIYRWRGADIRNILDFNKDYPYSKVVRLEKNYRSTKTIIEAAHAVISRNQNQIPKTLWTDNEEGNKISIFQCADDREEAFKIRTVIQDELKNGYSYKDIAVLYRTNAQSLSLENSLRSANIPYIIIGGTSFYKRKEIKDILSYLILLINPDDNEAFKRAINEPPRGIGLTSIRNLQLYADFNHINLLEACGNVRLIPEIKGKAAVSAIAFFDLIKEYGERISEGNIAEVVNEYISKTGLVDMYEEIGSEDSKDRIANIQQLLLDIVNYFEENDGVALEDYLQQISLVTDMDEKNFNDNNVALMTLHSAKGLEFPVVTIAGVERGLFPLERTRLDQEEEEEERRLFYVGITRAKKSLYITYALRRAKFGEITNQGPSKFISEIPRHYTNLEVSTGLPFTPKKVDEPIIARKPNYTRDEYSQISPDDNYSQLPVTNIGFRVGDKVRHVNFGKGKIVNMSGFGSQQKATVNFENIGNKVLMLQFAKLEKM